MLALVVTIGGIYVLIKGEVALTANKHVRGWRARVIGLVLASYFPIALTLGILLGVYCAMNQIPFPQGYAFVIDLGVIACCCIFAAVLGALWGKPKYQWDEEARMAAGGLATQSFAEPLPGFPPPKTDNPYQPPFSR